MHTHPLKHKSQCAEQMKYFQVFMSHGITEYVYQCIIQTVMELSR